jgi:hypothetical protein
VLDWRIDICHALCTSMTPRHDAILWMIAGMLVAAMAVILIINH